MTIPTPEPYGGCIWPLDASCAQDTWDNFATAVQERAAALASETLRRLTGYRVGGCPVTVRPCEPMQPPRPSWVYDGGYYDVPMNWGGTWSNGVCGRCDPDGVWLTPPIGRVDEVKVDGIILDPSEYRVVGDRLVSTGNAFPATQNLGLPDTEVGTFSVTYLNAYPVGAQASDAVGRLAIEYAKACTSGKCKLPPGVTTLVRQGVTMEIISGAFPGGMTGIREIDTWIALWNASGMSQSRVWSPDLNEPIVDRG